MTGLLMPGLRSRNHAKKPCADVLNPIAARVCLSYIDVSARAGPDRYSKRTQKMLKGLELPQMVQQVMALQKSKKDYIADTRDCTVQVLDKKPLFEIANIGQFPITPHATNQITARCGIPQKYAERMIDAAPDLYATNVNAWLRIQPEKRMVRTIMRDALNAAAVVRAFMSNRYQRIEHEEIAAVALPILRDAGVNIVSCNVTDRRMYIHFTVPTVRGEVKVGDVVEAGGIISNSETGEGSVRVERMTWRLICLNGARVGDTFRRNHVGRGVEETGELDWSDDTRKADDKAILLKVRDMVRACTDKDLFAAHLAKLRGLTEGPAVANPVEAVRVLAAKIDVNESEQAGILKSFCEAGDFSRWGLFNAVTAQAHTATDYDRAFELEGVGGSLLDLPTTDWQEILKAA